jgi:hypothetical protein
MADVVMGSAPFAAIVRYLMRKVDTGFRNRSCSGDKPERDDDAKKSHPAPATKGADFR